MASWKEQPCSGALHITDSVGANGLSSSLKKGPFNFCSFFLFSLSLTLCTRDLDEWVAELRSREERLKAREAALQEWEMALDVREKQLKGLLCIYMFCYMYSREQESHFRLHLS